MYPELFNIGPITVYTYGVLLAASYLLGLQFAIARARRWGLDEKRVLDLGIYIIIAALVGAKLLLVITDFDTFRASPADLLSLARSGGVFYGGLITAVGVAFWYIHVSLIAAGKGLRFPASLVPQLNGGVDATMLCFAFLYISTRGAGILSLDSIVRGKS